ncbi:MAG: hypothetical protein ACXVZV_10995 [Terriglobales bacterium]
MADLIGPRGWDTGPGSALPALIGVETVRADGSPTVLSNGTSSSTPIATACSPKEVIVVQLRRVR